MFFSKLKYNKSITYRKWLQFYCLGKSVIKAIIGLISTKSALVLVCFMLGFLLFLLIVLYSRQEVLGLLVGELSEW